MATMKKANADKTQERELGKLVRQAKRPLLWAAAFSFGSNMLMLAMPVYSLQVLDRVIQSYNFDTLLMLTIVALGCLFFYAIFMALRSIVMTRLGDWLHTVLSPRLMALAVENSAVAIPTNAGQMQRELQTIRGFISGPGMASLFDLPWSIIFVVTIYLINPLLGLISLGGAFVLLGFGIIVELSTKKAIDDVTELSNKSLQFAESSGRNAESVEAMGMMPSLLRLWNEYGIRVQDLTAVAGNRSNTLLSMSRFVRMSLQVAVIGVGAWLSLQNEMTVGGMIAASILMGRVLAPFENAIGTWKQMIQARDSYNRLDSSLTDIPSFRGTMNMPAPKGELKVEQLIYTPPNGSAPILKSIGFALNAKESLGIIGPSAAGKSTLARLLMGILPPTHGSVRLDGVDIFHWNRADLGQYVGYLPQNVELFPGTIRDNIARMEPDINDDDVIAAAQFAGCHEMILRLPQGYETEFNARMVSLSPGQRQRIGLARALYKNPSFVVLDEPNANLDGEGEQALRDTILRMKAAGITFILVAHKPSIVMTVDKILMLQSGMIKDFGLRDTVLKKYTQGQQPAAKPGKPAEISKQEGME